MTPPKVAVVGHVEYAEFAVVDHLPAPGEIVDVSEDFVEVAGGGSVAAVQMCRLAGTARFYTALGDDETGAVSATRLRELGVELQAATRKEPTRRGFVHLSEDHERTITVIGDRIVPHGSDPLPWDELADFDAVYFTGGDAEALRRARRARVLVATPRAIDVLRGADVKLDVLVASATDPGEQVAARALESQPKWVVLTHGDEGGDWHGREGRTGHWAAEPPPGKPVDAYGCGDSFAAALTFALGRGDDLPDALQFAARCGAHALTGRGPYAGQLTLV